MKTSKRILLLLVILLLGTIQLSFSQQLQQGHKQSIKVDYIAVDKTATGVEVTLENVLLGYAEAYNCFFTIEEAWTEGESMNQLSSTLVKRSSTTEIIYGNLQEQLEELRQIIPNFSFVINRNNPRIIHIIDSRLMVQQNYGLEKTLELTKFTGTIDDLIIAMGKQDIPIVLPRIMFNGNMLRSDDAKMKVKVKGNGLQVRDALSNFIDLKSSHKILWSTRTKIGSQETSYFYY